MHKAQEQVREFHKATGQGSYSIACIPSLEIQQLRLALLIEELEELSVALLEKDVVETADALADLMYLIYGTAEECGLDIEPIFDEVHRSNMTKIGPAGIERRSDGKILKPAGYEPPNIAKVLSFN